jgi:hypothetical protein
MYIPISGVEELLLHPVLPAFDVFLMIAILTRLQSNLSIMEYYSAINKNEVLLFAGKWIKLEIIVLSKISCTQKDKFHVFSQMQNLDLKEK